MKYFRLKLNDDNKKWKGYEVFDIDFYSNSERVSPKNAYRFIGGENPELKINVIKDGIPPNFANIGTKYLIANADKYKKECFLFNGLTPFEVSVKDKNEQYFVLHFNREIDCVDFTKSEFVGWPKEHILKPWENPIGQFFFKPALHLDKIPEYLDCFSLSNWGGPFSQVVSEQVKEKLCLLDNNDFLIFQELELE